MFRAEISRAGGTTILTGFDTAHAALEAALRFLVDPGVYGKGRVTIEVES
jgi:hypothetical protein